MRMCVIAVSAMPFSSLHPCSLGKLLTLLSADHVSRRLCNIDSIRSTTIKRRMALRLYQQLPSLANPLSSTCVYRRTMSSITLIEKEKTFLSSPRFAVVGASADKAKFGTKVSPSRVRPKATC